ncbi:MAG TPA: CocE/NonD family hydrolase [Steroidobacteraceae bacterium]|nr:CocE/NonD family hydrolase [Steroidobacteraceae bacterium]
MTATRLYSLLLLALMGWSVQAQELDFRAPAGVSDPTAAATMRDLAVRILPVYQESDAERYLTNLSVLQMAAANYPAAYATRQSLMERRRSGPSTRAIVYDVYARAKDLEAENRVPFAQGFAQSYRDVVNRLGDQDAYAATHWLVLPLSGFQDALQRSLDQWRSKRAIPLSDALELLRTYVAYDAYRNFSPFVRALNEEDDARRYVAEDDLLIKTAYGATIAAVLVRPKNPAGALPTLLELTADVNAPNYAKECAAHGYVGLVAYAPLTRKRTGTIVPYEHDGEDARAVIDWITGQSWSDGRVGMYGSGYGGFTPWAAAAAKRPPPALKAIAVSSPTAPGINLPMEGGIVHNSSYRWLTCVTRIRGVDEGNCADDGYWRSLDQDWYASGQPYRDFAERERAGRPVLRRWLGHPSYDRYWQKMIPHREQFAHVNIPVLAMTGYFDPTMAGALYYFSQHTRFNPHADHSLLIGPYDEGALQQGTAPAALRGYSLDPAALIDLHELRYQWFDHVLKGAGKPDLLKERVNYEVMGANEWRHAPSLEAMAAGPLKLYLDAGAAGADTYKLTARKSTEATFVPLKVSLTDRSDATWSPPTDLQGRAPPEHNSVTFVSEPVSQPLELLGGLSGHLDFTVNKMDVDLYVALYEVLPGGEYLRLFDPVYALRASYARDREHRQLLKAGERQPLVFHSERLTGRRIQPGSRIALVLGVNKRPDQEINYGTGGDVSDESIEDGKAAIKLRWYAGSYVEIPVRGVTPGPAAKQGSRKR